MNPTRRHLLGLAMIGLALTPTARARQHSELLVYKSPGCECCGAWVKHVTDSGFVARVREVEEMQPVKLRFKVPAALWSCHTATVDGYVIEGHVPAADIARLLAERPDALGLAVAGMPIGSPGMEQDGTVEAFNVTLFGRQGSRIFSVHGRS